MKPYRIVLGATGIEITPEPVASNPTEILTKPEIVGVFPVYNVKPNNIDVYFSSISSSPAIGDAVTGATSGATGIVVGYIGITGLQLSDVVGEFLPTENILFLTTYTGVGTSAGVGSWPGVTGATSGAGTGVLFDITDTLGTYDGIMVVDPGIGYEVGDTVTILGTDLGGATPANDLVITIGGETATLSKTEPQSFINEWQYPYPVMTIVNITMADQSRLELELQECTNQPTWDGGTLADLNTAVAAINA